MLWSRSPALRPRPASSDGAELLVFVGTPGQQVQKVLRPHDSKSQDFRDRFRVDKNKWPPGFRRSAQAATTAPGSGTCSSISRQVITSKGPSSAPSPSTVL